MEKFEQNNDQQRQETIEQLKGLFRIKLGPETSKQSLKESLLTNEYRKATVIITPAYDIYLSDEGHDSVRYANGLGSNQTYDGYMAPSGKDGALALESAYHRARQLRSMFVTPENKAMWEKLGEDVFVELIQEACAQKVADYLRELIPTK